MAIKRTRDTSSSNDVAESTPKRLDTRRAVASQPSSSKPKEAIDSREQRPLAQPSARKRRASDPLNFAFAAPGGKQGLATKRNKSEERGEQAPATQSGSNKRRPSELTASDLEAPSSERHDSNKRKKFKVPNVSETTMQQVDRNNFLSPVTEQFKKITTGCPDEVIAAMRPLAGYMTHQQAIGFIKNACVKAYEKNEASYFSSICMSATGGTSSDEFTKGRAVSHLIEIPVEKWPLAAQATAALLRHGIDVHERKRVVNAICSGAISPAVSQFIYAQDVPLSVDFMDAVCDVTAGVADAMMRVAASNDHRQALFMMSNTFGVVEKEADLSFFATLCKTLSGVPLQGHAQGIAVQALARAPMSDWPAIVQTAMPLLNATMGGQAVGIILDTLHRKHLSLTSPAVQELQKDTGLEDLDKALQLVKLTD